MSAKIEKIARDISERIRKVVGSQQDLHLHEPFLGENEIKSVASSIKDGWVSSAGPQIKEFELKLAELLGAKYVICVSSGTAAIELCLIACGVKPNTEVIIPSLTFCATANAIVKVGAIPNFVDVNCSTFGLDADKLEQYLTKIAIWRDGVLINKNTGHPISAIMPVHIFGHSVQFDEILSVAKKFDLVVIEDAAEALGSVYKGKKCGTLGAAAAISFNGNKIITTGGGGAVLTNNKKLDNKIKHLVTTAKVSHKWEFIHDEIGYNYRLPSLNAALGLAQISKIRHFLKLKRKLFYKYSKIFQKIEGVKLYTEKKFSKSNYWLQTIILDQKKSHLKNKLIKEGHKKKIYMRPAWKLITELKPYKKKQKMNLSGAQNIYKTVINLPSSQKLIKINKTR